MNDFMFYSPTQFVFGRGSENGTGELLKEYGAHRVLIVYGGGSAVRSGLLQRVERSLSDSGVEFCTLSGVQPNPLDDKVYEGIALARQENVDFLLAVGGGSVIDTAKAIAAGVLYDGDFWDFYLEKQSIKEALPVAVVLTIPAAGSEGSGNSVITKREGLKKLGVKTLKALRPKFAVMNPEITFTLPPWQTACGIADMMAHVLERYFSNTCGVEITDRLAEGVLRAIIHEAPVVMAEPENYDARANIMWAGTLAHNGLCGTGREEDWASHFLEHELSALYNVTHGAGLAVIMPAWMEFVSREKPEKAAQLAQRVFSLPSTGDLHKDAMQGVAALRSFFQSIGLPTTMRELNIPNPDIPLLVKKLHENKGTTVGFYVKLDKEMTEEIFSMAK